MKSYIETVKQVERLSETELDAVEKLRPLFKTVTIAKNDYLFQLGEVMNISFMVEKGLLRLYIEDENFNEKILQFLKEKDFFDDCKSYYGNEPISYTLQAIEDTEITYFLMADFERMAINYPVLNSIGININYEIMMEHKNHLALLMDKNPENRYRQILDKNPCLVQRLSVTHLSQYLGMSRECLSRIRAKKPVH